MAVFDPRRALIECGVEPLPETTNRNGVYRRVLPFHCCTWERGFFMQLVLLECKFEDHAPDHRMKATFCLAGRHPKQRKKFYDFHGNLIDLPVLVFYVVVNRLFQPWDGKQNRVEWLTSLTGRTKNIAHELLYADRYARFYDWEKDGFEFPLELVTSADENALQCPFDIVEKRLHTAEQVNGLLLRTESEFLENEVTIEVQRYFRQWLEQAVERDVCHDRTLEYLRTGFRVQGTLVIRNALQDWMAEHGIIRMTRDVFDDNAVKRTEAYEEFVQTVQVSDFPTIDEATIYHVTMRILGGSGMGS